MPVEQLSNARALKQELSRLHGLPTRFRQRLLLDGNPLDDSAQLVSPAELELVLLSYSMASRMQAEELAAASTNGSATEALSLQSIRPDPEPQIPHPDETLYRCALRLQLLN